MDAHGSWVAARPQARGPGLGEDRGWVPAPVEDNSEAAWAEYDACWRAWEALQARHAPRRAGVPARPVSQRWRDHQLAADLATPAPAPQRSPVPPLLSVDEVMRLARANDRVCPSRPAWRLLYQLLPVDATRGQRAPFPVDRLAWSSTPDLLKRLRLREQLEWAQARGALAPAWNFLRQLQEVQWHHLGPVSWPPLAVPDAA
jgi:hypothetical protein